MFWYNLFVEYNKSTFNLPDFTNRWLGGNGTGYLEAGLPNITGTVGMSTLVPLFTSNAVSGAFSLDGRSYSYTTAFSAGTATSWGNATFNASSSSSIYGNSTTVQPATCKTYFIIKY